MERYRVWEIFSYAWSEVGMEDVECEDLVRKGAIDVSDLAEVDRLFFRDGCASFAVDSFLIFPLMLWMLMPDWGFSEDYLRRRMNRWYARPYWTHFLNPLRVLGYPVALVFAWSYRRMLRRVILSTARLNGPARES